MNANKLADELDTAAELEIELGNPENWADFKKAATMIRQQQAEIEALKYEKSSGVYDLAKTLTDEDLIEDLTHFVEKLHRRWGDDLWIDATDLMAIEKTIELLKKASEK